MVDNLNKKGFSPNILIVVTVMILIGLLAGASMIMVFKPQFKASGVKLGQQEEKLIMCLSAYNVSRCYFLTRHLLYRVVRFILAAVGAKGASVTIVFVTDDKIRRLNALYRGVRRATDVLAFSMKEGKWEQVIELANEYKRVTGEKVIVIS